MEPQTPAASSFTLLELFNLGGVFMWPLLVFSIAAVAIVIERAVFMLRHDIRVDKYYADILPFIKKNSIANAILYVQAMPERTLVKSIFATLLDRSPASEHQIERSVETEAQAVIATMEAGFNFLPAIGSIAPLTGFLGTVSGMIGAFRSIAEATEVNAQIVANGIYEALITTVFGLIIAIIAMVAHSLLTAAVDRFALDTEQSCSGLITEIAALKGRYGNAQHIYVPHTDVPHTTVPHAGAPQ
jgi:biopolymer transport protein ExbB